jgi:hypothetical protein
MTLAELIAAARKDLELWDAIGKPRALELIAALEAMQWRPIDESTPRDGTLFWGRIDDDAIAMQWHPHFEAFVSSWREMTFAPAYGGGSQLHSPVTHAPTHWKPLDAPPAPEAAKEADHG